MVKSLEESARERRNYIEQARAAFHNQEQGYTQASQPDQEESAVRASTLGVRLVIAAFLFACFVYFEQEKITFFGVDTQEIVRQLEWNPLPTEKLEEILGDVTVSRGQEEK